jgi:hypothetical protein
MSNEMALKKKEEIENLQNREQEDRKLIAGDICPVCGMRPTSYPYICFLPNPYGWVECASCGTIFCPKSIRDQKVDAAKHNVKRPGPLVEAA